MSEYFIMDILAQLKPIGEAFQKGDYFAAQIQLEDLWRKIPAPKESLLNSYLIVSYGAVVGLKAQDLDRAWEWAQRALPYSGTFNLKGESELLIGEVAYARADFETAKKYFKIVKKMSGTRLFRSKNPKYEQLINEAEPKGSG